MNIGDRVIATDHEDCWKIKGKHGVVEDIGMNDFAEGYLESAKVRFDNTIGGWGEDCKYLYIPLTKLKLEDNNESK